MESKVTYIRGSKKYPEKVIEYLESQGGFNICHLQGTSVEMYYYINPKRYNQITFTANPLKEDSVIIENIEDTFSKESSIFIKGDLKHGSEIIEYLESLGGRNTKHFNGFCSDLYYYIRPDNKIESVSRLPENYKLLTYFDIKNQNKKQNLQTLDIEVPDGYTLEYNPETQKVEFIPCRSKSWEEFCKNNPFNGVEYYLSGGIVDNTVISHCTRGTAAKGYMKTKEDAEGVIALIQLTRLHDEWTKGWIPNWKSSVQEKYVIRYMSESLEVDLAYRRHHFLCFPNTSMAHEFLECFRDLIEKAKKFI